jgi:hypothetical protein
MRDRRAESSRRSLNFLVHGRAVLMNHVKFRSESEQAFRVTNEKIAFGIQATVEFVNQAFLFGLVEIDHHIAAKNHVVAQGQIFRFQIVEVELN